ncbi:ankyrin repeat-containing domain protein [Lactarius indigo]|nr:ankyrin repeat-containing domain protein [Lactarius indigo]
MAAAQILRLTHSVDDRVKAVNDKVTGVKCKLKDMDDKMDIVLKDGMAVLDDMKWKQLRDSLRRWVAPPDPSTNHNIACDIHHGGTAAWFFQGGIFAEWKSTGSLLWIYGKPGSGKSILCSTIIQDIASLREKGSALMAYFYFDFRDLHKQHRRNLLPSLLIQLSAQSRLCCDILLRLYSVHDDGEQKPSDSVMVRCLKDMLAILRPQPVYIILDALDECPNWPGIPSPREQVLALVKELVDLHLPHLHICVTSRPEFDIRATLTSLAHHRVSLHDESGQKNDIIDYVNSVVYSDSETMMKKWREDEKKMVVEALSEKADGMFRWVFCQLDTLRQCLPSSVRQTLEELPESLDETYERIVTDIKKANSAHAYRMLQCLAVAIRPLSVAELAELLAFDFDAVKGGIPKLNPNWRWEDHEQAVLSTCSSLITIVTAGDSQVVQFSHFSVKEFLLSDRLATSTKDISRYHISLEDANTVIARACLGLLLHDHIDKHDPDTMPLARYAARYWVTHARVPDVASRIRNEMEYLFDPNKPYFSAWVELYDVGHREWSRDLQNKMLQGAAPLYYAALCGIREIVGHLTFKYPQYANAICGKVGTALHSASVEGHVKVVRSLLKCGVDVDVRGIMGQSPLQLASRQGHLNVVEYLLRHGANANFRDVRLWTPLSYAATWGRLEIVRVLLEPEYDADVNSQDEDGLTPIHGLLLWAATLYCSSQSDHPQIVRLLLEHGANPNIRDNRDRTPLHLVSSSHLELSLRLEITRTLLAYGADVDAEDETGRTPLKVALAWGKDEIVQLLSSK